MRCTRQHVGVRHSGVRLARERCASVKCVGEMYVGQHAEVRQAGVRCAGVRRAEQHARVRHARVRCAGQRIGARYAGVRCIRMRYIGVRCAGVRCARVMCRGEVCWAEACEGKACRGEVCQAACRSYSVGAGHAGMKWLHRTSVVYPSLSKWGCREGLTQLPWVSRIMGRVVMETRESDGGWGSFQKDCQWSCETKLGPHPRYSPEVPHWLRQQGAWGSMPLCCN